MKTVCILIAKTVCILIVVIGSYIYAWNEPYNFTLPLKIPWLLCVCFGVGVGISVGYIYKEWIK